MNKLTRVIHLSRLRAAEGHLGLTRQLSEILFLRLLRGVGPRYYHMAGFWRREIPWKDKINHLNAKEYRRCVKTLNPMMYRKLSQNKIAEKAILGQFRIPTPRFLGFIDARNGRDSIGNPLRAAKDLERLVESYQVSRLVFKPTEGWGGKRIHIPFIERTPDMAFYEPELFKSHSISDYCLEILELDKGSSWLVEEYLEQHRILSEINPGSVNTIRIWIIKCVDQDYHVLTAYLRIGIGNMSVDNASSGGLVAPIDLDSGQLHAAQDADDMRSIYALHPNHHAQIEGVILPFWLDTQKLAIDALAVFPGLRFAGLDVAISPSGPVIIELNVSPDREGAAFTGFRSKIIANSYV